MKSHTAKLKTKLQLSFVFIGFLSVAITGWQAYESARTALEEVTFQRLTAVRESRRRQIEYYFERIRSDAAANANDQTVIHSARALRCSFASLVRTHADRGRLAALARESDRSGRLPDDPALARHIGIMRGFDANIRIHLRKQGYYDMLLVSPAGDVIYSVRRQADFGTNLAHGRFRGSNVAAAFHAATAASARTAMERPFARFVDFEPYEPSGGVPASFAASAVYEGGSVLAVLIYQISIDEINTVMTENSNWQNEGLGESGETYIVGTDYRMRNDSRFFIEEPQAYFRTLAAVGADTAIIGSIRRQRTSVLLQEVRTDATRAALQGKTDTRNVIDYRGVRVLSSFAPLDIPDLHWVLLSEIDETEAFRSVNTLREQLLLSGLIILLFAVGLGFVISQTISRPIHKLIAATESFGRGNLDHRAQVRSSDEIGLLARTFNRMADKITSHTRRLEDEVRVRRSTEQELMQSEERLRNLSRHLQTVREEERKGIAREIHDELGQNLTMLKLHLSLLHDDLPSDSAVLRAKFHGIIEDIDVTIQSVKRLISDLRPGLLDDLGLVAAIEWQTEVFQRRTGIHCELSRDPVPPSLDADRSIAVFRIFQETLTNIARHAHADHVTISLIVDDGAIRLQVRDNGRGITAENIDDPRSFGLMGIRERAHYWGGSAEFRGEAGIGTSVSVVIPYERTGAEP